MRVLQYTYVDELITPLLLSRSPVTSHPNDRHVPD